MKTVLHKAILPALFLCLSVQGATIGGIDVPEERDGLLLNGAGLLRKGFFFKIYVGALYVAERNQTEAGPLRLDIHYFHNTPKKLMVRTAEKTLRQNLSEAEYDQLRPHIEALHDAYLDGEPGACASIIHRPGEGLIYLFNGQNVITIPGDNFAKAYLTIWLGENPSSHSMKNALLDNRAGKKE